MRKAAAVLMIIIFTLTSGCIEKKVINTSQENKIDKFIVYSLGKEPEDLILLNDSNVRDKDLLLSLFEGLVKVDESGNIVPGLAESWTVGKDDITYTFKIREEARWSDGSPITAKDFQKFFSDMLSSKQENIYAYQLYYIFGAQEYRNGKKSFNNVAVRAVDDKTLEIRLNSPVSYFLQILSQPIYTLRKINDGLKNWKEDYKAIAYSGPFKIDDISAGSDIALIKNEFYYDAEEVKSDKIYITPTLASENALAKFNTSKINILINPPISETKSLIVDGNAEVIPVETGSSINFNFKRTGSISNESFRKAISLSINRDLLLDNDLNYMARSATAYVPYSEEENLQKMKEKPLFDKKGDSQLSKKLFEESKYNKKEKIKLVYLENNENKRLCEAIVKDIKEELDINLEAQGYSETELTDVLKDGDYHMFLMNYAALYDDPVSVLEAWSSKSELNLFGYKSEEFDSLLLKTKYEKDTVKRQTQLKELEKLLLDDVPAIPIYFHNIILCKKPSVEGVYVTKEGNIKLDRAYIDDI